MQVLSSLRFQGVTVQGRSPVRIPAGKAQLATQPADSFVSFSGKTRLMKDAEEGNYDDARDVCYQDVLETHWNKINRQDGKGETALMKAVDNGHEDVAELLSGNGGCLSIKDNKGRTVLDRISDKTLKKKLIDTRREAANYSEDYNGYNSEEERMK